MKLLLTADSVGGVWQYATDLARALQPHGIQPVLAVLGPSPSDEQRRAAAGVPVIDTGLPLDWLADTPAQVSAAGQALAALARREQVDLVQLNAPALAAGADFAVPVIAVAHSCLLTWWEAVAGGSVPEDFSWRAELHAEGLRSADLAVTPSVAFGEATRRVYQLERAPVAVHNGRARIALPEAEPETFACTAGRLWDRGKDVATLDRAAALLKIPVEAAGPLFGPNGDNIALRHAHALGALSEAELARRLTARPIFGSAALYEPFGLAVLEAAQAGCALVLSDIPTFRELWDGAAVFVAPGDANGFAAAITGLAEDRAARAEWGGKAAERARRYTPEAMAAEMASIYRGLLGREARAAA